MRIRRPPPHDMIVKLNCIKSCIRILCNLPIHSFIMSHGLDISLLSSEQLRAFHLFTQGHNVFVSGPGGSGKGFVIRFFVQYLFSMVSILSGHLYQIGRAHV